MPTTPTKLSTLSFDDIRNKAVPPNKRFQGTVLCFDPGETTGVAEFNASEDAVHLVQTNQLNTWPLEQGVRELTTLLDVTCVQPKIVVFERYGIYAWKTDEHTNSEVPTIQVIGCIKTLLIQRGIPYKHQTAQVAKEFCTDAKLEQWGFWKPGMRHARDAIRHGCYYLLFDHKKTS